jgi:subtilisin family serine protease
MIRLAQWLLPAVAASLVAACAAQTQAARAPPLPNTVRSDPSRFVVVTVANESHAVASRPGSTPRGYDATAQYGVTSAANATVRALEHDYGLSEVSAWPIASLRVHCIVFRVPADGTTDGTVTRLAHDPRVESVQRLNEFTTQGETAGDSHSGDSYQSLQVSLRTLAVPDAHRWSRGAGVRVAVIDTGVDFEHPDLKERVLARRNFVDGDEERFRHDRHGTEVAGVIAASADNDVGIVGVAPESRLIALKACWQVPGDGGARAVCNSFTLAQALEAAILARVDIVNMSLAGPPDPLLARLVARGLQSGILFVGAVPPAGMGGGFPADVSGVLAVEAAEESTGNPRHLLAPGHEVLTLVPGGHWDFASGSSFAAAEVSGTLALLVSARPGLTAPEAQRILAGTEKRIETDSGVLTSIDACEAVAAASQRNSCADSVTATKAVQRTVR